MEKRILQCFLYNNEMKFSEIEKEVNNQNRDKSKKTRSNFPSQKRKKALQKQTFFARRKN